ncbi:MAG: hypothetical protein ACEPOW_04995 [Bacteroidales bacterium]
MKKLLFFLLLIPLTFSCKKDKDENGGGPNSPAPKYPIFTEFKEIKSDGDTYKLKLYTYTELLDGYNVLKVEVFNNKDLPITDVDLQITVSGSNKESYPVKAAVKYSNNEGNYFIAGLVFDNKTNTSKNYNVEILINPQVGNSEKAIFDASVKDVNYSRIQKYTSTTEKTDFYIAQVRPIIGTKAGLSDYIVFYIAVKDDSGKWVAEDELSVIATLTYKDQKEDLSLINGKAGLYTSLNAIRFISADKYQIALSLLRGSKTIASDLKFEFEID